jgi:hypothetical protein
MGKVERRPCRSRARLEVAGDGRARDLVHPEERDSSVNLLCRRLARLPAASSGH